MIDNEIRKRLNEEIRSCGKSLKQIANEVGISPAMLTEYKTRNKMPSLETFAKLCKVIDASADYILGLSDF